MVSEHDDDFAVHHDEDMPKTAAITVATVAGKKFVAGLFWQPLTKPRAYRKEAQEIGKREGMDIVTIRRSTIMQAGFAPKGQGAIKGMHSLAAALAGKLGNSWIGVFDVGDDQFALVAVDDGAIIPGCDVIGARDDIFKRLKHYYNAAQWGHVYVPADFDFGGEEADAAALLADDSFTTKEWREFRLQPLKFGLTPKEMMTYGIFVAAVLAAAWGALQYREQQLRQERDARIRAEQARLVELERVTANTKKEKAVKTLEHPWVKVASSDDFVRGCGGAIETLPLSVGGWLFDTASCDGAVVKATYARKENATANGMIAEAEGRFDAAPAFSQGHDQAELTRMVKLLYGGDDALSPVGEMLPAMASAFQGLGIKTTFTEKTVAPLAPKTLPGAKPAEIEAPPTPDWKTYSFNFNTETAPGVIFSGRSWSGMRVIKLEVKLAPDSAKLTWTVIGEVYAK